jgi:ubiquinone biosynthesis protein COQ4
MFQEVDMAIDLREARRAMAVLAQDPDDTVAAIQVIGAMAGKSPERCFKRFKRSAKGRRILAEKQELFDVLSDLDRLAAMPDGSLGKEIWRFYTVEELSAEGLKNASEQASGANGVDDTDAGRYGRRMRDLHDVFHVVTGYGRDLRGEVGCLAFTFAQTWNTGIGYLVFDSLKNAGWWSEQGRFIRQAFRRGRRSEWLVDQDWESLLEQPLERLRMQLGVGPAPVYEQVRSAGAPVLRDAA